MSSLRPATEDISNSSSTDNLVHNLSSKDFTPAQLDVLSRCANINIANASVIDFVASLEVALARPTKTQEEKLAIRHNVTTLLMNITKQSRFSPSEMQTGKQVNSDEIIIVPPADKRRAKVILDKTICTEKTNHLLQDITTYQPSKADTAKKMNQSTKSKIESLRNSGAISKNEFDWIKPSDSALNYDRKWPFKAAPCITLINGLLKI